MVPNAIWMLLTQPSSIWMYVTRSGIRMKCCGQYASGSGLMTTGAGPVLRFRSLCFIVVFLMVVGTPPAVPAMAAMTGAATAAAEHEEEKQPAKQDPYQPSVLCPHGENPPPAGIFHFIVSHNVCHCAGTSTGEVSNRHHLHLWNTRSSGTGNVDSLRGII